MAQAFLPQEADRRTFGGLIARLTNDLNRPDLTDVAIDYALDAMRFFQRIAFFFSERDNRTVPSWQPNTFYPLGSTIRVRLWDRWEERLREFAFVAMSGGPPDLTPQQSGEEEPAWTDEQYLQWIGSDFYQPPEPDWPGITEDHNVLWANIGPFQRNYHTQLTTVPNSNQYLPPLDWVVPYLVQCTTANLRLKLVQIPFHELSQYDVIQPAPIAAYPRFWAYWQQQIYLWVYPMGFFPLTLNYISGPNLVSRADDSNYWTTTAERLIRKSAQAAISREILYDTDATQLALSAAAEELARLKNQAAAQQGYRIPPGSW